MKESDLESLLRSTQLLHLQSEDRPPAGFATQVFSKHLRARQQNQIAFRTASVSVLTAACIFASIVGLNFSRLTSPPAYDPDPVIEVADSVWDSAGN